MKLKAFCFYTILILILVGCGGQSLEDASLSEAIITKGAPDLDEDSSPKAGNSGTLSTSNVLSNGVTLSWTAASDDTTAASSLQYKVVYSTGDNISTVADAKSNGTTGMDYTANTTSKSITGLSGSTSYYINVLVKDEDSNESNYTKTSFTTTDDTAPVVGNSGALNTSSLLSNGVTLSWSEASDDTTTASSLQYKLVYSTGDNISTVADANSNGTTGMAYTANTTSSSVTGLSGSTSYYVNVLVKDEIGNESIYTKTSFTTYNGLTASSTVTGSISGVYRISATKFSATQALVAYINTATTEKGYYRIYNIADGTISQNDIEFSSGNGAADLSDGTDGSDGSGFERLKTITLKDGTPVIIFYDIAGPKINAVFINTSGAISSTVQLKATAGSAPRYLNAVALSGGGFAIFYHDATAKGYVQTHDSSGTLQSSIAVNSGVGPLKDNGAPLSMAANTSDKFVLAYRDDTSNGLKTFEIFDYGNMAQGGQQTSADAYSNDLSGVSFLSGGNIFFSYNHYSTTGKAEIYNSTASTTQGNPITISNPDNGNTSVDFGEISQLTLASDYTVIFYDDANTSNKNHVALFDDSSSTPNTATPGTTSFGSFDMTAGATAFQFPNNKIWLVYYVGFGEKAGYFQLFE